MRIPWLIVLALMLVGAPEYRAAGSDTWSSADSSSAPLEKAARIKRGVHWYRYPNKAGDAEQEQFAFSLYQQGKLRKAANAYQALVYAWPDSPRAAAAQLALAKIQQQRGDYGGAFEEYQYLIDHYPGRFNYPEVLGFQFQIANYLMHARVGKFLFIPGFRSPGRAVPLLEKIVQNAPSWERAPEAQYSIGWIHEEEGDKEEAVAAYELLQNRYPGTDWAMKGAYREACCLYVLSTQRRHDENALNAARAALVAFIRSYPGSPDVATAETYLRTLNTRRATMAFERARFYDRTARRPGAALEAYTEFVRNFPNSELAEIARNRIEQLGNKAP